MAAPINPRALLLDQTEVTIALAESPDSGRGYAHIRASLGESRWAGLMPIGRVSEPAASTTGDLEQDLEWWWKD